MKKKWIICSIFLFLLCVIPQTVYAEKYLVLNTNKYFRTKPGGTLLDKVVEDGVLLNGAKLIVLDTNGGSGYGCKNNWYKVKYQDTEGYICSSGQVVQETVDVDLNGDFEQQMLNKGFPSSYLPYLKSLHEKHPNWVFTPQITNIDFEEAITNENYGDISVVDGTDESLRAVDQNGNYIMSNEAGWYVASRSTVQYYMDPRNFLSDAYIFMFENLSYNSTIQTKKAIEGVTKGSFLQTDEYTNLLQKAASNYQISPVYLASRIRQEKGTNGGTGTNGAPFTYAVDTACLARNGYQDSSSWDAKNNCGTNETYSGIYNFYNIGAYSSYQSAVIRGLIWAKGGFDSSVTTYLRPWDSKEKGILGGAYYIADKFINKGQSTLYLQKFNVMPPVANQRYTHQYMTNVRAHAQEAYKIYTSYAANDQLNNDYEFAIPVYQNMQKEPDEIKPDEPKKDDDNKEEVQVLPIENILTASGYRLNNQYMSAVAFNTSQDSIQNKIQGVYANTKILAIKDKYFHAKAGNVGTGDKLTITNGKDTKDYTIIIYGDNNGDGKVTVVDLLRVQKYLLNASNLTQEELIASDTNKDGKVNVVDLLRVQKQLLGNISIEQ